MKALLIICAASMVCNSLMAQIKVLAQVLDATDSSPLIGATIYLMPDGNVGTTTGLDGSFELKISEGRQDSLLITYLGYREQVISIADLHDKILLQPVTLQLTEVSVTAEPLVADEFKYVSISKVGIYTHPMARADPLLAVNAMPSSTTTDESASISLRGSGAVETGVFLNNVPVYNSVKYAQVNGIGAFSLFNTALIKEVTVFPGNPPLEFGNSTSGVVSLIMDESPVKQNTNSLSISPASIGCQHNQKLPFGSLKVYTNYQPSHVLKWMNPDALENVRSFQSADVGAYIYGKIGTSVSYKVYNYLLNEGYNYDYSAPTFVGAFIQERFQVLHVTNVNARLNKYNLSWNQGLTQGNSQFEYSIAKWGVATHTFYQALSVARMEERWQVKSGIAFDATFSRISGSLFQLDYAVGAGFPTMDVDNEVNTSLVEAYAYGKYYLTNNLIVGMGARKNLSQTPRDYLSKQFNLTCLFAKDWNVIAGFGSYHKYGMAQSMRDKVFIISNQSSVDFIHKSSGKQISFSLFYKANKINEFNNRITGFEAYGQRHLWSNWLVDGSFTYLKSLTNESAYFTKSNLSYKPGYWTFALSTAYRTGNTYNPVISATYIDGLGVYQPFYTENADRLADYFSANLSVSRLFPIAETFNMIGFASITNMTDRHNIRTYTYNRDYTERVGEYLGRRIFYAGIQVNF